ncbi:MAG TPA: cupin domain-containing protein [Stellaceae bacterium]|jgi:mannose-6-phosphate isomerase-like protein (cupin superfamily)|nr:cupin domain-containing protein [Stellaceae bacterium]
MQIIDHEHETCEEWRSGVTTRMRVSSLTGTAQLCLFEQWCAPGSGAPTHLHAVEEVLSVVAGRAEVWVEEERGMLGANQSLIIPAGRRHGFRNVGDTVLHVQATLAASSFEASFDDPRELSRRWLPRSPTPELR